MDASQYDKDDNDKSELFAIGTKSNISQVTLSLTIVSISGYNIPFSQSVRNLGVFIDETLSWMSILNICVVFFFVSYAD